VKECWDEDARYEAASGRNRINFFVRDELFVGQNASKGTGGGKGALQSAKIIILRPAFTVKNPGGEKGNGIRGKTI